MKHYVFIACLCLVLGIGKAHAQFTNGVTGLLHMPNAEMQQDGMFVIGGNFLNKHNLWLPLKEEVKFKLVLFIKKLYKTSICLAQNGYSF